MVTSEGIVIRIEKTEISTTNTTKIDEIIEMAAEAVSGFRSAIKTSVTQLNKTVTKVYSREGGFIDAEFAGHGRLRLEESEILEGVDKTEKKLYDSYVEAKLAEDAETYTAEIMRKYIQPTKDGFDAFIEIKYRDIRKLGLTDITNVAQNAGLLELGYSEADLIIVKRHLFLSTHDLSIGGKPLERFYMQADQDIAYGWQKAQMQKLTVKEQEWFKSLMKHELKETEIMEKEGLPLRDPSTWNPENESFGEDPIKNAHDKANYGTPPNFEDKAPNPAEFPEYNSNKDVIDHFQDDPNVY